MHAQLTVVAAAVAAAAVLLFVVGLIAASRVTDRPRRQQVVGTAALSMGVTGLGALLCLTALVLLPRLV